MTKDIEFIEAEIDISETYYPVPAKALLPDWFKKMGTHINGGEEFLEYEGRVVNSSTAKKCMPMFDAITSGYLIVTTQDVETYIDDNRIRAYRWPDGRFEVISHHVSFQSIGLPVKMNTSPELPKWMNPWGIRTPKGYSCLFVNPMNRFEKVFRCFEGVVDTDVYINQIHFPFYFIDEEWEGRIPAGTPIMQVIPFKRESWAMKIRKLDSDSKITSQLKEVRQAVVSKFYNAYKTIYWSKKDFS